MGKDRHMCSTEVEVMMVSHQGRVARGAWETVDSRPSRIEAPTRASRRREVMHVPQCPRYVR